MLSLFTELCTVYFHGVLPSVLLCCTSTMPAKVQWGHVAKKMHYRVWAFLCVLGGSCDQEILQYRPLETSLLFHQLLLWDLKFSFTSWFCHLLSVWIWVDYLVFQGSVMGIILSISQRLGENRINHVGEPV